MTEIFDNDVLCTHIATGTLGDLDIYNDHDSKMDLDNTVGCRVLNCGILSSISAVPLFVIADQRKNSLEDYQLSTRHHVLSIFNSPKPFQYDAFSSSVWDDKYLSPKG